MTITHAEKIVLPADEWRLGEKIYQAWQKRGLKPQFRLDADNYSVAYVQTIEAGEEWLKQEAVIDE